MRITVCRRAHFNAAHRLHNPELSPAENAATFGKCNNEYYHGHNYELIVHVTGDVDPKTGYLIDMKIIVVDPIGGITAVYRRGSECNCLV